MVPPPALTVWMSSIGTATSRPATTPCVVIPGCSALTSATSQLVPPMSKVMRSEKPAERPSSTEAATPPAGPDSTVVTGSLCTCPKVAVPPLDCMM